jgi:hypothetical protein
MKPNYRVSLTVTTAIIVAALLFPPWKGRGDEYFVGFYFIFEDRANLPLFAVIDYKRLAIAVICIALLSPAIHFLLHICIALLSPAIHFLLHIPGILRASVNASGNKAVNDPKPISFGSCPHCNLKVQVAASSCGHCGTRFLGDYRPIAEDVHPDNS